MTTFVTGLAVLGHSATKYGPLAEHDTPDPPNRIHYHRSLLAGAEKRQDKSNTQRRKRGLFGQTKRSTTPQWTVRDDSW